VSAAVGYAVWPVDGKNPGGVYLKRQTEEMYADKNYFKICVIWLLATSSLAVRRCKISGFSLEKVLALLYGLLPPISFQLPLQSMTAYHIFSFLQLF